MAKRKSKRLATRLSAQEMRLIEELCANTRTPQAFLRAGLSASNPYSALQVLKKNPIFAKALNSRLQQASFENNVSNQAITDEYANIAFLDISDYYRPDGTLKSFEEIPPNARRAICGVNTTKVKVDQYTEEVVIDSYQLGDKLKALESLGKSAKNKYFSENKEAGTNVYITSQSTTDLVNRLLTIVQEGGSGTDPRGAETQEQNGKDLVVLPRRGAVTP